MVWLQCSSAVFLNLDKQHLLLGTFWYFDLQLAAKVQLAYRLIVLLPSDLRCHLHFIGKWRLQCCFCRFLSLFAL
jgi:hypothetical protein